MAGEKLLQEVSMENSFPAETLEPVLAQQTRPHWGWKAGDLQPRKLTKSSRPAPSVSDTLSTPLPHYPKKPQRKKMGRNQNICTKHTTLGVYNGFLAV